jgi:hypothetical protein
MSRPARAHELPVRLAFREEGNFWNAYLALSDTMERATLIGSVRIGPMMADPDLKRQFIDLMKSVMQHAIEEAIGVSVDHFNERTAPESERSGNA